MAYLSNLPYDVEEDEITLFFKHMKIANMRIPKDDRDGNKLKGFGYIEFEDRDSLLNALVIPDTTLKNRRIRIEVAANSESDRRRGRMDMGRDRGDRSESFGDWRSGPRTETSDSDRRGGFGRENNGGFSRDNMRGGDREERTFSRDNMRGGDRDERSFNRDNMRERDSGFSRDRDNKDSFRRDRDGLDDRPGAGERASVSVEIEIKIEVGIARLPREDLMIGMTGGALVVGGLIMTEIETEVTQEEVTETQNLPTNTCSSSVISCFLILAEPRERPKLNLAPRTKPIENVPVKADTVPSAAIFGAAKPVDTSQRKEIEEKLAKGLTGSREGSRDRKTTHSSDEGERRTIERSRPPRKIEDSPKRSNDDKKPPRSDNKSPEKGEKQRSEKPKKDEKRDRIEKELPKVSEPEPPNFAANNKFAFLQTEDCSD
ncbi:hypothetical protein NQ318_021032 [Aromia moschata]|uniref:RRM domain-containing protein n=1 Tax=Aromia moschata TaxID=1265417 RepID=A0AAV8YLG4_9CUCU|nr:hypothetical protein NQ318_021032 [Aromia moschata]